MPLSATPYRLAIYRLAILLLTLLLCACSRPESATPTPDQMPQAPTLIEVPVTVEVTVEVTRIVTQPIIVEATPIPPEPCAQRRLEETSEVTIGALLPLSGPGALSGGFAIQAALNHAVEKLQRPPEAAPDGNATTYRLITYDTAGRAERAAEFAHRLLTLDCAAVLIGGFHSPVALATSQVTEMYRVPYLVVHAASDEITAMKYSSVFRLAPSFSMYASMPAKLVTRLAWDSALPIQDALILVDPASFSDSLSARVLSELDSIGVRGKVITVDLPTSDHSPTVARILSRPQLPQILFIYINGEAAVRLLAQLLQAGIGPSRDVQIVTNQGTGNTAAFWTEVPDGVGTIIHQFGPWSGDISPQGQEFMDSFSHAGGGTPPAYVFAAYDAVALFVAAHQKAGSVHGPELIAALAQSDLDLSAGRYAFPYSIHSPPDEANAFPPIYWQQWLNPPLYYLRYTAANQAMDAMELIWSTTPAGPDSVGRDAP